MKKIEFENHVLKIYINEEEKYVLLQWLSQTVHTEFVDGMTHLFKLMSDKQLTKMIGDVRLLGSLDKDSIKWTNEVMMPKIYQFKKTATVVPEDEFDKMITEDMMSNFDLQHLQEMFRSFNNLEEAEAWIKASH